jgi:hypothetical protein
MSHKMGRDQTTLGHTTVKSQGAVKIVLTTPPQGHPLRVHVVHDVSYEEACALATSASSFKWIPNSAMPAEQVAKSVSSCSSSDCLSSDAECPDNCGCMNGLCY